MNELHRSALGGDVARRGGGGGAAARARRGRALDAGSRRVPAAAARLPGAPREAPYPGAKEMLLVDTVDDPAALTGLLDAMYAELPESKRKKGGS